MGRVSSNVVGLAYTEQSDFGTIGSNTWHTLEPNNITQFGASTERITRNPIGTDRQRSKGTIVDLNSAVSFDADLTMGAFRDFLQGFMFSNTVNREVTNISITAVTGTAFTAATALTAAQAAKIPVNALVWASGFGATNDGLHPITTASTTNNAITATSATAQTQKGQVSLCGYRNAVSGTTWTYSAPVGSLNKTGLGTILEASGLKVGQFVHFGSIEDPGDGVADLDNGLDTNTANNYGFGRVRSISANAITFDKLSTALQKGITPTAGTVDIMFGEFSRNVPTGNDDYKERYYTIEGAYPNLGGSGATEYEYANDNLCNTLGFDIPLTNKATVTFGFVGTSTDAPTATRKNNTHADPIGTEAFNTSADIARLRITETDETGLTSDFKSLTVNINNNASGEKVVGTVGSKFINVGNFTVDITAQMLFTDGAVLDAINNNETLSMDFALSNGDGVIIVDIDELTLGGGDREFPENQSVLFNATVEAHKSEKFGSSVGVSLFPVPIPS